MQVLIREVGERVAVPAGLELTVLAVRGGQVRLGLSASAVVEAHRDPEGGGTAEVGSASEVARTDIRGPCRSVEDNSPGRDPAAQSGPNGLAATREYVPPAPLPARSAVLEHALTVYRFFRRQGLEDARAAELMRLTLLNVARGGQPTRRRAGIEDRLFDAAVANLRGVRNEWPSSKTVTRLAADWEEEVLRQRAARALDCLRQEVGSGQWQAFWLTAVEGQSAESVALTLGTSAGAVRVDKCRILCRLRDALGTVQPATAAGVRAKEVEECL